MADRGDSSECRSAAAAEIPVERAELLRALSAEQRVQVLLLLRVRRFERQRVLYVEGAEAESLWILRSGRVRLYKTSTDARATTLELLEPGRAFGALSALAEPLYASSAESVTAGSAWLLPRPVLLRVLAEEPRLVVEVLSIVTSRLREAHERLRSFASDSAAARLAGALIDAARGGEAQVTRRALAEAAGTTVETAIRVLRRLEREGVVEGGGAGHVRIADAAALRRVAGRA